LSHYQLTLEPNTAFAANPPPLPDDDLAWDMQEACQQRIAAGGLQQYEVSAYARPGRECVHNLNYWRFGDYLGIGAGAHGKVSSATGIRTREAGEFGTPDGAEFSIPRALQIRRRWKVRTPRGYLEHAATARRIGGDDAVAADQVPFEFMLNALRLNDGFALEDFASTTGLDEQAIRPQLDDALGRGWLELSSGHVRATPFGRRFLNDVIAAFLPERTRDKVQTHGGPPHD
jgi:oxygen-independent coproporphyrinogen-3 oxidase